jgi:predicted DNA-binding transcriptional regulator AlpA
MAKLKSKLRSGQRGLGKSQSGASKAINVEAIGKDILTLGERAAENKPETSMVRQGLTGGLRYLTAQEAAKLRNQGLSSFWRQVQRGELPQPYRVSPRCPRWLLSDVLPTRGVAANDNEG